MHYAIAFSSSFSDIPSYNLIGFIPLLGGYCISCPKLYNHVAYRLSKILEFHEALKADYVYNQNLGLGLCPCYVLSVLLLNNFFCKHC